MIIGSILIIDDEQINTETIKDTLEDVNYKLVLAHDAAQAKAIVKTQTFDLVIMDGSVVETVSPALLMEISALKIYPLMCGDIPPLGRATERPW